MTFPSAGTNRTGAKDLVKASHDLALASRDLLAHARELRNTSTKLVGSLKAHHQSFLEIREKLGKKLPRPTDCPGWRA